MATPVVDQKISQLTELTQAKPNYYLPIENTDIVSTEKIQVGNASFRPATKIVAPQGASLLADYYTIGANDDTMIQSAINAAGSKAELELKEGIYQISNDILIPSNFIFRGKGMGITTIKTNGNIGLKNLHNASGGDGWIKISDLTIDAQTLWDVCLRLTGCQHVILERIEIINTRNTSLGPTVALGINGLTGVTVNDITIRNCRLQNIGNYGINIEPISTANTIKDIKIIENDLLNVETGIAFQKNASSSTVSHNYFDFPGGVCIGIKTGAGSDASHTCADLEIVDNIWKNADTTSGSQAISIGNSTYNAKVSGNKISNFDTGVYQNFHPQRTKILHNDIIGSTYGIRDVSGGEYAKIDDNDIANCGIYGIWYNSPVDTLSLNRVINSGNHGIYLQSGADGVVAIGNKCYDNGSSSPNSYSGIEVENVTDGVFIGNECTNISTNNQKYGIEEAGSSDHNSYVGNNTRGNGTGAMNLLGVNNTVRSNHGYNNDSNEIIQSANVALLME